MANKKTEQNNNQDFVFVQEKSTIVDIKLKTKPTTFFKDAMRRFVKNKASVLAASVIGFLVTLSILVPILNPNDIVNSNSALKFLPPRWAVFENFGINNGTIFYKNIIVDNITDPGNPRPVGYDINAVTGGTNGITIREDVINAASEYATGGLVAIRPDRRIRDEDDNIIDPGIVSPNVFLSRFNDFSLVMNLPDDTNRQHTEIPQYKLVMEVRYASSGLDYTPIVIKDFSSDFGVVSVNNLRAFIVANMPEDFDEGIISSYSARFAIIVKNTPVGEEFPILYVESFIVTDIVNAENDATRGMSFTSGNDLVVRDTLEDRPNSWNFYGLGTATKTVYRARIFRGDFYYNPYEAVFGEKTRILGETILQQYILRGYMAYDFSIGPSSFQLLSDESPLRSVASQTIVTGPGGVSAREITGVVSMYRFYGYRSMPYFFFGTNHMGYDYFKVVFSGLSTSLLLGLMGMLINVSFGMVWGSISGYFGGNVDLVMERITEILGGVPWIVIITLAVLTLGRNFSTFLLAITLTGWIGTSSLTRSQFYRYKRREYVLASRTLGAKDSRLIFRHILPNSIGPIVTSSVLLIPGIIFLEATVSYLGLGLQGFPSLGVALSEAQNYLATSPYLIGWGSVIISLLMISFNLFGNGLRDAFNPSLKGVDQ
jgi:ABC-type dipeptide/oligopeptide/nickel transport system permease subunit